MIFGGRHPVVAGSYGNLGIALVEIGSLESIPEIVTQGKELREQLS